MVKTSQQQDEIPVHRNAGRMRAVPKANDNSKVDYSLLVEPSEREMFEKLRDRVIQQSKDLSPEVRLGEIYQMLAQGLRTKHILKARPYIRPEVMTLAHSYLMVHMPLTYARIVDHNLEAASQNKYRPRRDSDISVLVDENLTTALCPSIRAMIGRPQHVNLIGLRGTKDPELWEWAVNNGIDVIITKDRATATNQDLTRIAENDARSIMREHLLGELPKDKLPETSIDMVLSIMRNDLRDGQLSSSYNELPLIVHIVDDRYERGMKDMRQSDYVAMLLRKHRDTIFNYIENRNTPIILVRHKRVECGPTYNELLMSVAKETMSQLRVDYMAAHGALTDSEKTYWKHRLMQDFDRTGHAANDAANDLGQSAQMLDDMPSGLNEADRIQFARNAYTERVFQDLTGGFKMSAERMERALEMAKAVANRFGPGSAPTGKLITRRAGATPIYVRAPGAYLP